MTLNSVTLNHKALRAGVIVAHAIAAGRRGVVCLSCGNAAAALEAVAGDRLVVVHIGDAGQLQTRAWWSPTDVARMWPGFFDGTPGHLPLAMMAELGRVYAAMVGPFNAGVHDVPTGSGETLVALAMACPGVKFRAVYDDRNPATRFDAGNPLNELVRRLAWSVVRTDEIGTMEDL